MPNVMKLTFDSKKDERRSRWLLRQFSCQKNIIVPKSQQEYMDLHMKRGLSRQYRDGTKSTYFPTAKGWDHFRAFVEQVNFAEPIGSRATYNDTFQAFGTAFARMLSDGLLPDEVPELAAYLPAEFIDEVTGRFERIASKLNGIEYEDHCVARIGHCWIGRFDSIDFGCLSKDYDDSDRKWLESLSTVFEPSSPIIISDRIPGTSDRIKQVANVQYELTLSVLSVLTNMTYEGVFARLWQIRRMDRPEQGFSKHFSFSLIQSPKNSDQLTLGIGTRSLDQWFKIDGDTLDRWHDRFCLGIINQLILTSTEEQSDLEKRWTNSLLYFRQATSQRIPEMQIATLWICVESFFTADNENILDAILAGLLAITASFMPMEIWPKGTNSLAELRRIFARFYRYRSRTFHHGRRGHVTATDVQEFSYVVCNLIVGIAYLISSGIRSSDELLERARSMVGRIS